MDSLHRLRSLPPGARADLLRVLTSPSNVRADVIRQFHERRKEDVVDLLIDLEGNPILRAELVVELQQLDGVV